MLIWTLSFLLFILCQLTVPIFTTDLTTLTSVQILSRHGDREPNESYKSNLGRLTDMGKKEMHDLGLFLRQRYSTFLRTDYTPDDILLISSDTDRTIESTSLTAFGLYHDFNMAATWSGNADIQYQPIPVRTIPAETDKWLQMSYLCPRYDQLVETSLQTWLGTYYVNNNKELLDLYEKGSGDLSFRDTTKPMADHRLVKFTSFHEEMIYKVKHSLPLEDWQQQMLSNKNFTSYRQLLIYGLSCTEQLQRLYVGPFIEMLLTRFEDVSSKKMTIYTGHDRHLYALMLALGLDRARDLTEPPTSSAIMFELHSQEESKDESILKVYYRNTTDDSPIELKLAICGTPCTLKNFRVQVHNLIPEDYAKECTTAASSGLIRGSNSLAIVGIIAAICLIGIAAATIISYSWKRRRAYSNI